MGCVRGHLLLYQQEHPPKTCRPALGAEGKLRLVAGGVAPAGGTRVTQQTSHLPASQFPPVAAPAAPPTCVSVLKGKG